MATITNISMYIGEDRPFIDVIYRSDGVTPQDITGWGLTFVVHAYGDPNITYITKSISGGGITVPVPSNGQATVTIAAADTASMMPNLYQWYIQRTDGANNNVLSAGLFTLNGK